MGQSGARYVRLSPYRAMRDFRRTPEPTGATGERSPAPRGRLQFVVQKHAASRLHYDFRLEHQGVLKSWAIPKGPSLNPRSHRLAVPTEDHPLEYGAFEGVIPEGEYGGGTVLVWDRGVWLPEGEPAVGLDEGKLRFSLEGERLRGRWTLVRTARRPSQRRSRSDPRESWLLIKRADAESRPGGKVEIVDERTDSVLTGRSLEQIAAERERVWHSASGERGGPPPPELGQLAAVAGARPSPLPRTFSPQLATLTREVPESAGWFHEPKLDGYRLLCRIEDGLPQLFSRSGKDWTAMFPGLCEAARSLPCRSALLDGEAVVLDRRGVSRFQLLQNALGRRAAEVRLFAFDLLYLDGYDLREATLRSRKELLRLLLPRAGGIRYADHLEGRGADFLREACRAGLEGIISKRADDPYRGWRSRSWLKIKCRQREEFVVVGFTEPGGSRTGLGSLLLGTRDEPGAHLRYAGRVGTGFSDRSLRSLREELDARSRSEPPLAVLPPSARTRGVHWVEPELVAEVTFAEWTRDGVVRQPVFEGLREDKSAAEVVREPGGRGRIFP